MFDQTAMGFQGLFLYGNPNHYRTAMPLTFAGLLDIGLAENIIEQFSVTLQSPSECVQILRYWIDSAESIARRLLTITYKRQLSIKIRTFLKGDIWASVRDIEVEKRLRESLRFLDKKELKRY